MLLFLKEDNCITETFFYFANIISNFWSCFSLYVNLTHISCARIKNLEDKHTQRRVVLQMVDLLSLNLIEPLNFILLYFMAECFTCTSDSFELVYGGS